MKKSLIRYSSVLLMFSVLTFCLKLYSYENKLNSSKTLKSETTSTENNKSIETAKTTTEPNDGIKLQIQTAITLEDTDTEDFDRKRKPINPVVNTKKKEEKKKVLKPVDGPKGIGEIKLEKDFSSLNGLLKQNSNEYNQIDFNSLKAYTIKLDKEKEEGKKDVEKENLNVNEENQVVCEDVRVFWIKNSEKQLFDSDTNTLFYPIELINPKFRQLYIEFYKGQIFKINFYLWISLREINPLIEGLDEVYGEHEYISENETYLWAFTDMTLQVVVGFNYNFPKLIRVDFIDKKIQKEYFEYLSVIKKEIEKKFPKKLWE